MTRAGKPMAEGEAVNLGACEEIVGLAGLAEIEKRFSKG
jgi:hypothetical protein